MRDNEMTKCPAKAYRLNSFLWKARFWIVLQWTFSNSQKWNLCCRHKSAKKCELVRDFGLPAPDGRMLNNRPAHYCCRQVQNKTRTPNAQKAADVGPMAFYALGHPFWMMPHSPAYPIKQYLQLKSREMDHVRFDISRVVLDSLGVCSRQANQVLPF